MSQPGSGEQAAPFDALPTDTYFSDGMKLSHFFNGEGFSCCTSCGSHRRRYARHFRQVRCDCGRRRVSHDELSDHRRPETGGTINGVIDGLNQILDLSVPEFRTEEARRHSGPRPHQRLRRRGVHRDMVTIIRDRIQAMMKKGMTLEQVKAAKPTADYDPRHGSTTGPWTTEMFIEAVCTTLDRGRSPRVAQCGAVVDASRNGAARNRCSRRGCPSCAGPARRPAPSPRAAAPIDLQVPGWWSSPKTGAGGCGRRPKGTT